MRGSHSGLLNLGEGERLERTKRTEVLLRLLFPLGATHWKGEGMLSHGPNEAIRHSGKLRLGPRLSHAGWDVFKISTLGLSSHKHGGPGRFRSVGVGDWREISNYGRSSDVVPLTARH